MKIDYLLNPFHKLNERTILTPTLMNEGAQYSFYSQKIDEDTFNQLIALDPTDKGYFQKWLVESYIRLEGLAKKDPNVQGSFSRYFEDTGRLIESMTWYYKIISKKAYKEELPEAYRNIMNIKVPSGLNNVVETFLSRHPEITASNSNSGETKNASAIKVYDNDGWLIVSPQNEEASKKYGAGTKWCTAADQNNQFAKYSLPDEETNIPDYPLYIIIGKAINRKWQFHFNTDSFMDEKDDDVSLMDMSNIPKEVLTFILTMQGANSRRFIRCAEKIKECLDKYEVLKKIAVLREEVMNNPKLAKELDEKLCHSNWYIRYTHKQGDGEGILKEIEDRADIWDFINTTRELGGYTVENRLNEELYSGQEDEGSWEVESYGHNNPSDYLPRGTKPYYANNPEENPAWNEEDEDYSNGEFWEYGVHSPYEEGYSDGQIQEAGFEAVGEQSNENWKEYYGELRGIAFTKYTKKTQEILSDYLNLVQALVEIIQTFKDEEPYNSFYELDDYETMLDNLLIEYGKMTEVSKSKRNRIKEVSIKWLKHQLKGGAPLNPDGSFGNLLKKIKNARNLTPTLTNDKGDEISAGMAYEALLPLLIAQSRNPSDKKNFAMNSNLIELLNYLSSEYKQFSQLSLDEVKALYDNAQKEFSQQRYRNA